MNRYFYLVAFLGFSFCLGCDRPTGGGSTSPPDYGYGTGPIVFHDDVESNASAIDDLTKLEFLDASGEPVKLADRVGEKNIVLVVTRGYSGAICLFCSTQTSRLIARHDEIVDNDAEVLVVFPVKSDDDKPQIDKFVADAKAKLEKPTEKIPFPVLLDVELMAVDKLGIRQQLSKPATYILDKEGQVRFAYVGKGVEDRPSVDAIISQLKQLGEG